MKRATNLQKYDLLDFTVDHSETDCEQKQTNIQKQKRATIRIPSCIAAPLIGIKGTGITKIKRETGTQIHIGKEPDKKDKVEVVVRGTTQKSVQDALTRIREFEADYDAKVNARTSRNRLGQNETDSATAQRSDEASTSQLSLENNRVDKYWDSD